ncbi:SDR family NAD(P)-dependent oxidoreductase [Aquimarina litoralis]|uniref:SDR family NAD(P)-dependent oxidoreductase n=1 Tax=Aquimarina litoralis TaxID=584605 RepID=UPI001C584FF0|nr:SDR family NAD(P)-dependent oxidoreductase [Aquimarina litoralis]MBW1298588.1 SDR family NAD(P)-dependent oxidoreductase [Aquimarina litoralis]
MSNKKLNRRNMLKTATLSLGGLSVAGFTSEKLFSDDTKGSHFKEKVAFITGGARGIGYSIAEELAKLGVHIAIYDIAANIKEIPYELSSATDLENAKTKIVSHNVKCLTFKGDVRNEEHLKNALNETKEKFGKIDFLVANAAVTRFGELVNHDEKTIQTLLDVNLKGVINTVKTSIPIFKEQNSGRIITISSMAGREGTALFPVYSATKWGVIGFTKSMAIELGTHNITCNTICPTGIRTKLVLNDHMAKIFGDTETSDKGEGFNTYLKSSVHTMPVGLLDPIEIAKTAVFLCSDGAQYITGAALDVAAGCNSRNSA